MWVGFFDYGMITHHSPFVWPFREFRVAFTELVERKVSVAKVGMD